MGSLWWGEEFQPFRYSLLLFYDCSGSGHDWDSDDTCFSCHSSYGTAIPLLGTNPLSIAVPASCEKPIVLDMSMSTVARGKIRYAALNGERIPEGWGLDSKGRPTTDPNEVLNGGSVVPVGGPKGSGLALIVDIICGILTNSCLTGEVKTVTDMSGPSKTGHMFCAVNISSFIDVDLFKSNIDKTSKESRRWMPQRITLYICREKLNMTWKRKGK